METVREGDIDLQVPEQPDAGTGSAVFYNREQELNRDITIGVLRGLRERNNVSTYCDATCASGVRGVRAAADGWEVTAYDVNPEAVDLAQQNFKRNELSATVTHEDARGGLYTKRYDVVDIDPFGTPAPFIDAAVNGTNELLCITATDLAPLCGAHFTAGVRRYSAVPRNTDYHREMGLRILLSAVIRTAARHDVAATPILSHATRHYVRTYLSLDVGAKKADAVIDDLGYIYHCQDCLARETAAGHLPEEPQQCPHCGSDRRVTAGPVWLGGTHSNGFVKSVISHLDPSMGTRQTAEELLETIAAELDTPTYYDQHRLCKLWSRSAESMDEFLNRLRSADYPATRTHFGGTTFKTTADIGTIRKVTT